MTLFSNSLRNWESDRFHDTLIQDIKNLKAGTLPLLQGVSHGGIPDDSDITVSVLNATDTERFIHTRVGVFFTEILAGCSCGDEPMSMHGYCELQISIDKATAEAEFNHIQS